MMDYATEALRWTIVCLRSRTQSLLITEGPSKGFAFGGLYQPLEW